MLSQSPIWQRIKEHVSQSQQLHMNELFAADLNRASKYSVSAGNLYLDYSKNIINDETFNHLIDLAKTMKVEQHRDDMFAGVAINKTEDRAVLHTALRSRSTEPLVVDGINIRPQIADSLKQMQTFVDDVQSGRLTGFTGKPFTDVISVGIGGSFLGPKIMSEALKPYHKNVKVHFVANVDGCHIQDVVTKLSQETTLVITSSKTLTTQETLRNTNTAKAWFLEKASEADIAKHFACVSTNIEAAQEFGIAKENIFPMWDWVGGRYSIWSAIGLPLALAIGMDNYLEFLAGANEMDEHFCQAPLDQNMPVIMALLGVLYRNFYGSQSQVILPYYHYLRGLPAYIQQLDMESNGKSVNLENEQISYATGPIIWGSEGTNGQHSFHQLIHQSNTLIPVDFLMPLTPHHDVANHHEMLASNCFGQSQALMEGQSIEQVQRAMKKAKSNEDEVNNLASHKVMQGNKPSNTLLFNKLCPKTLGSLIALYEQKVFVQGVIWQVNSFDQWGVELGKALGNQVLAKLQSDENCESFDASTNHLINLFKNCNGII